MDTTLRDGAQAVDVSFELKDRIKIALELDGLGIDYIEGGWPGANPKDSEFFAAMKEYRLKNSKLAAFGSTLHRGVKPEDDPNLNAILSSGADAAVIFGKSWVLHVDNVLRVSREDNLRMVYDSVSYLKANGLKVVFDAEHFYQGFLDNGDYAMDVLKSAHEAGADVLALADTNGGTMPNQIFDITRQVASRFDARIGLHMHNDIGCAVANTLMGVVAGATHVQGTINGIGERTGNADLVQVLPSLALKLGRRVLGGRGLERLKATSLLVSELSGLAPNQYQPFVGGNAFAHKAGVHSDAMLKDPRAYEHMDPKLVGNARKTVLSGLSGAGSLVGYAEGMGLKLDKCNVKVKEALETIKRMEAEGYSFDLAPESAMLVLLEGLGLCKDKIVLDHWKVISEGSSNVAIVSTRAVAGRAEGVGPVDAIDAAIKKVTRSVYPELANVSLADYRVTLPGHVTSTSSIVRVKIEFTDGKLRWRTMGVSSNIIDASVKGLLDGLNYYLWLSSGKSGSALNSQTPAS